MQLNNEQIKFIDTYLKNADVIYIDIRMEMIDHVASGIEHLMQQDKISFYDAFKKYMISNKSDLLDKNKQFRRITDFRVVKLFLLNWLKPYVLLLFLSLFTMLMYVFKTIDITPYIVFLGNMPLLVVLWVAVVMYGLLYRIKKQKYAAIERLSIVFLVLFQVINLLFIPFRDNGGLIYKQSPMLSAFVFALILLSGVVFTKTMLGFKQEYLTKLKMLVV